MTETILPYYERTLDSFADHIITNQYPRQDGSWHAVLDCSFEASVSDPDFSPHGYGDSREQSAQRSAAAIRRDAQGIGKFAPHSVLVDGYDLKFKLMRHWDKKERLEAAGVDLVEANRRADGAFAVWSLEGSWIDQVSQTKTFDFDVQLAIAEMMALLAYDETLDPAEVKEQAIDRFKADFEREVRWRVRATNETWEELERQFDEAVTSFDPSSSMTYR